MEAAQICGYLAQFGIDAYSEDGGTSNWLDAIAIRPIMNLTLTYDHRLVDGALAGRFLRDLRERLQSWGESDY